MSLRSGLPTPATTVALAVLVAAIAGITHIASVLALPWRSADDAFSRIAAATPPEGRAALRDGQGRPLPFDDPAMLTDVCRFDLGAKPFRLALSPFADGFVTIGFHGRHGVAFYGLTVRAVDATAFDLVLETKDGPHAGTSSEPDARTVTVTAPEPEGFVTLATPHGGDGDREDARERLDKVSCRWDASSGS